MEVVIKNKPKTGVKCNHCGYCCLTEVCCVGVDITGSDIAPCKLLEEKEGGFYCSVSSDDAMKNVLGFGEGCCAETQKEVIERLRNEGIIDEA